MKFVIPTSLLIIGLAAGYLIGVNQQSSENATQNIIVDSNVENIVYDTIYEIKYVEIEDEKVDYNNNIIQDSAIIVLDSVVSSKLKLDTLQERILEKPKDTILPTSFGINKDELITTKILSIVYLNQKDNDTDSLIKSVLDINTIEKKSLSVEFWKSPIDYHGYKLSLSKLIIYGVSPQHDYSLYKKNGYYYLSNKDVCFELQENSEFSSYTQVDFQIISND